MVKPTVLPSKSYNNEQVITQHKNQKTRPETMLDDYEFLEILGEGAFAKVYKCVEKETQRVFAAKKIDFHGDKEYKVMVEYEVEILKGLRHENLVSLHTAFSDGESYYVIMEYVDGGNLFDEIVGRAVYTEKQACRIVKQVLQALEYLHKQKIVHRDIKPDNILLQRSKDSDDVTVKITDFGLARRLPEGCDTLACEPSGAPMFLAPETILEEPVGCAVDIWSVGVILYCMLVGYPPFWSSSDEFLLLSILEGRFTMPSPYWDNIKPQTKDLVSKLIVKNPQLRLEATQALAHPALSDSALGRKVSVEKEVKRNFMAVACGIRALVKFKKANVKSASRRLSERGADLKSPHTCIQQYHGHDSVFE